MANGYEKAMVILAENNKTQTELLTTMSKNIEGMRVELRDNTQEMNKLNNGLVKIGIYLAIGLMSVAIPTNAVELGRMIFGGGL